MGVRVHLIDGTYELFRMFYGAPSATTAAGREVAATRAIARNLLTLAQQPDVTHLACAFDTVITSFRNEMFDGYKSGEGIDPELHQQFELAEQACEALGITYFPLVEFEADDGLASAAAKLKSDPQVEQILICSPDKDMAQCVEGRKIVMLDRKRGTLLDQAGVARKFGVEPKSIPDYLALVGDSADGIPGVARWGAKSTATVLAAYGHLEAIPDDHTQWTVKVRGAASLAKSLAESREDALLYRKLATLRTDAPVMDVLDDIAWQGARRDKLEVFSKLVEDPGLISRVRTWL